jgi:hypothetical protein
MLNMNYGVVYGMLDDCTKYIDRTCVNQYRVWMSLLQTKHVNIEVITTLVYRFHCNLIIGLWCISLVHCMDDQWITESPVLLNPLHSVDFFICLITPYLFGASSKLPCTFKILLILLVYPCMSGASLPRIVVAVWMFTQEFTDDMWWPKELSSSAKSNRYDFWQRHKVATQSIPYLYITMTTHSPTKTNIKLMNINNIIRSQCLFYC